MTKFQIFLFFSLIASTCYPPQSYCQGLLERIEELYEDECCKKERMHLLMHAEEAGCFPNR